MIYIEKCLYGKQKDKMLFETEKRRKWIDDIKSFTGEENDVNVIQYCLSYTLQSLKNNEDMDRFKWRSQSKI